MVNVLVENTVRYRALLRQFAASVWPGPLFARQRVAVSGLPRSGTSWLAKALSLSPRVSYYFEPDNRLGSEYMYRYMQADTADPGLKRFLDRAFRGHIHDEYTIAEQGLAEILRHPLSGTVLVKLVRLPLALDWLAGQFPGLAILQIVRHPAPQFLSWKQRNWSPGRALRRLLEQQELMDGPLAPYRNDMRCAESFWEQAGVFWGAVARLQLQSHRDGWYLREHEWYCADPLDRIHWQLDRMGLSWSNEIGHFINGDSARGSGPGYGRYRDPRAEIHKWEGRLSATELNELESAVKVFKLPFYPGLDPEHTWLSDDGALPQAATRAP